MRQLRFPLFQFELFRSELLRFELLRFELCRFPLFFAVAATAVILTSCGGSAENSLPVQTVGMGDKIPLGHINYQVFETRWLTQIGVGPDARVPQHRFFLVRLQAHNSLGSGIIVPNFILEDDSGNTYPELNSGEGVPQYIGYLRSIKPDGIASGNAVFDVPPRHYKMKITDETGEKAAYVDIPLNFVSETPEPPGAGNQELNKGKQK